MNLSFVLDNVPYTPYIHTIPSSTSDPSQAAFTSNQTVFFAEGLEMTEHELVVNVGEESTFIFDYLVYRQDLPDVPPDQSGTSGDAAVSDAASSSSSSVVPSFSHFRLAQPDIALAQNTILRPSQWP
jgi:hypothetical protein